MKVRLQVILGLVFITAGLGATERLKKEFEVGEKPELRVEADGAEIIIEPGSSGLVVAHAELPDREHYSLEDSQDGDKVKLVLEHSGLFGWFEKPVIRVQVPEKSDITLSVDVGSIKIRGIEGNLDLRSGAGHTDIEKIKGEVYINSGSGTVGVEELEGKLEVSTGAGGIELSNSTGEFHLETSTGGIDIYRSSGSFQVSSDVGSIYFDGTVKTGADSYLKTDIGSITVTLTDQKDIEISAETDLGDVSISPEPKGLKEGDHFLVARIGEGSAKLRLRSSVGSIHIKKQTEALESKPEEGEETE